MRLAVYNIGELITACGPNTLRKGKEMNEIKIIKDGYIIIENEKFIHIGEGDGYKDFNADQIIDAKGLLVTPGLIDSHTHLVHASSREDEFLKKLNGMSYLDILKSGGGIHSTVEKTRKATFEELYQQSLKSLRRMMEYGVVAVEAKSGYGLDFDTEIKQLKVAKALNENQPVEIVSTFMKAHAIPKEYQLNKAGFINEIKQTMDYVKKESLAKFCDVFCEEAVFSASESEEILNYAKSLGLGLKIHADEISSLGASKLAAKLECISSDHLMATTEEDMRLLAKNNVVCSILPLTSFYLDKPFARTRLMIENGCGLAISTDYNPGSSPSENLLLAMQIASIKTKMTPMEVLTAVTINAAVSLGIENKKGSITIGKDADFVLWDSKNLNYIIYHFGINHVKNVYIKGKKVI